MLQLRSAVRVNLACIDGLTRHQLAIIRMRPFEAAFPGRTSKLAFPNSMYPSLGRLSHNTLWRREKGLKWAPDRVSLHCIGLAGETVLPNSFGG
ncbi:hypothetical protein J4Q44_G00183200 [Coregonus suidteri]|uniref:Uncharacterized protein n=1 Tax=Coregonus suidteri TaxID=861788 RepID=A0AAN8QNV9_9TELE